MLFILNRKLFYIMCQGVTKTISLFNYLLDSQSEHLIILIAMIYYSKGTQSKISIENRHEVKSRGNQVKFPRVSS